MALRFISEENAHDLEEEGFLTEAIDNKRQISPLVLIQGTHGARSQIARAACEFELHLFPHPCVPRPVTVPDRLGPFAYEYIGFTEDVAEKLWSKYSNTLPQLQWLHEAGAITGCPFIKVAADHWQHIAEEWEQEKFCHELQRRRQGFRFYANKELAKRALEEELENERRENCTFLERFGIKPAIIDIILADEHAEGFWDRPVDNWAWEIVVRRWRFLLRFDEFARKIMAPIKARRSEERRQDRARLVGDVFKVDGRTFHGDEDDDPRTWCETSHLRIPGDTCDCGVIQIIEPQYPEPEWLVPFNVLHG